jgi:acyl carrier protein
MTDAEIEKTVKDILVEKFECSADDLTLETDLFADLDLDSIDAVDLVVILQKETNKKINPESFRSIRKLGDVVKEISKLVNEK